MQSRGERESGTTVCGLVFSRVFCGYRGEERESGTTVCGLVSSRVFCGCRREGRGEGRGGDSRVFCGCRGVGRGREIMVLRTGGERRFGARGGRVWG